MTCQSHGIFVRQGQHRGRGRGLAAPPAQQRPDRRRAADGAPVPRGARAARAEDRHRPLVSDAARSRSSWSSSGTWSAGRDPGVRAESREPRAHSACSRAGATSSSISRSARAKAESREGLVRQSKLITTITAMLYNFLEVTVGIDPARPDELQIVYANASRVHRAAPLHDRGLHERRSTQAQGSSRRWTSERTAPDRVVFRLAIPSRLRPAASAAQRRAQRAGRRAKSNGGLRFGARIAA